MLRSNALIYVLATAFVIIEARFTAPILGQVFTVESPSQVTWETTGLTEPLNVYLVPGGATTVASKISDIASKCSLLCGLYFTISHLPASQCHE